MKRLFSVITVALLLLTFNANALDEVSVNYDNTSALTIVDDVASSQEDGTTAEGTGFHKNSKNVL